MYDELKRSVSGGLAKAAQMYDEGPDSARREPEMSRAIARQQSVIEELEGVCKRLEDRLRGVLAPESPTEENVGKPERLLPPLVQAIDSSTDRVQRANMFISDLLNRLEV